MKTVHLVWNGARNECVGFLDEGDANYAATGSKKHLAVPFISPSLADSFRDCYGEDARRLPQTKVEINE